MCSANNCLKPKIKRGFCEMHYRRFMKHGDTNYINPKCNRDGKAKERARARTAAWKKRNWATYKHYLEARRMRTKLATPKWADLAAIQSFYSNRPAGYHVDHIIPLNGKNVCGLHILSNLQYLPAKANLSKGRSVA